MPLLGARGAAGRRVFGGPVRGFRTVLPPSPYVYPISHSFETLRLAGVFWLEASIHSRERHRIDTISTDWNTVLLPAHRGARSSRLNHSKLIYQGPFRHTRAFLLLTEDRARCVMRTPLDN